jgi:hypothetical protein
MSKPSTNRVKVEAWTVKTPKSATFPDGRKVIAKVAVRNHLGRFHGATNFKGSVVG